MRGRKVLCLSVLMACLQMAIYLPSARAEKTPSASAGMQPDEFRVGDVDRGSVGQPPSPETAGGEDHRVEVPELRTRTGRTFLRGDGLFETEISPDPIHFRDAAGAWQPIDNRLLPTGNGGYRNSANSYRLELPATLRRGPVMVERQDGRWLGFQLRGAEGVLSADGDVARYKGALPDLDLTYTADATQVKEMIVLRTPAAVRDFTFDIDASDGLEPTLRDQTIEFSDASGEVVFTVPAPFMFDASGDPQAYSRDIVVDLSPSADGWELRLVPSAEWLEDRDRVWPVTIDPGVELWPSRDCHISSGVQADSSSCGSDKLLVGNDGVSVHRALVHFDVAANVPTDSSISKASISLNPDEVLGAASGAQVRMHVVEEDWTTGATWNRRDGINAWTAPGGTYAAQATPPGGSGWAWDGLELVQDWSDGARANRGVLFKEADESIVRRSAFESSNQTLRYPSTLYVVYAPRVGVRDFYKFEDFQLSERIQARVNVASGNLVLQQRDVEVRGTGINATFDRTYNSRAEVYSGVARGGAGQKWVYDPGSQIRLSELQGNNFGNLTFTAPTGVDVTFEKLSNGTFKTPPGLDARLEPNGLGGTSPSYDVVYNHSDLRYVFDSSGGLLRIQDRNGNRIALAYDTGGTQNLASITDTQGRVTTVLSDANGKYKGRVTSVKDPAGRTHLYGYDGSGNLISYTDPANKVTQYAYDSESNLISVTTPGGDVTQFVYDSASRVTSVKRVTNASTGAGSTTGFAYQDRTTLVTDPRNNVTTYEHDARDRVSKVTDAQGNVTSKTYTSNSNVESYTDAAQSKTLLSYSADGRNNLTGVTLPTGAATSFSYDDAVHPYLASSKTDDRGNAADYTYDSPGNVKTVADRGSGSLFSYSYNPNGTLATMTDAKQNVTSYGYDAKGNLTSVTYPGPLGKVTMTYDGLSRLTSLTDGKGQTKSFTYDALDRTTGITFAGGASVTYAYDGDGSLTGRSDNTGTTGFTYDTLNRMTKKTFPNASTMTYGYDPASNLTTLADSSGTTSYAYDSVNQATSVTDPSGAKTTFAHDGNYRRTSTSYPNGVTMSQSHDGSGRLRTIESKNAAGSVLTRFSYSYADPTSGKDTALRQSVTDKDGNKTAYGYDSLGRLKSATSTSSAGSTTDTRTYTYDGNGNRLSQTINSSTTSYSYNAANQLTQAGSTTYNYDLIGNMTGNSAGLSLSYNSKDQTTSITPPGGSAFNMVYADANQTERTSAGTVSYASGLLGVQSEKSGTVTVAYLRDEKGRLVSQRNGSATHYYLFDGLGSVVGLTDGSGTLVNTYKYDPWGQDLGGSRQVSNPWRFASGYFDSASGLYKFGTRYYDPTLGSGVSSIRDEAATV